MTLEAYLRVIDDHELQWRDAVERARAVELPEPPPIVQGRVQGVIVTLNSFGQPVDVHFERPWIDSAQPGTIASHVVAAARQAQDRFVPVENPMAEELERHALEHRVLMAGFYALLNQPR